jgi:hypothetical protein
MTTGEVDRNAVAMAIGQPLGDQVLDGQAKLAPVTVPGIQRTVVWRVRGETGEHPWQVYVGIWPDGSARLLTADQEAWADLVSATGAHLDDEADARAFVEAFLEATRGALVIVEPITSLDDLHWRPGSDNEEEARAALLADPPAIEPSLSQTADGYHVELTLVVDQVLQRNTFDITRAGEIASSSFRVLAEHLPLPIAR